MKLPIIIESPKLLRILSPYSKTVVGKSLFIFIIVADKTKTSVINHEKIHYRQQVEMLFLPMWLAYAWFYIAGRIAGEDHRTAYRNVPFEREAYEHERNSKYLQNRRFLSWIKYLKP